MRILRMLLAVLCCLLLAACVTIPTSGPVQPGSGSTQPPRDDVEIAPEPPEEGASPRNIVAGFLHAMTNSSGGFDVARQYLTPAAARDWRPEQGVEVYADGYPVTVTGDTVVLKAPLVGELGSDGAYRPGSGNLDLDFRLVRVDDQWRIANPPNGVLVSQYLFRQFYQRVTLYWFDPSYQTLVPDPVYLPRSRDMSTTVLRRLLTGPTAWASPVVASAVPSGTVLNVAAPVDEQGVVEVSLSKEVRGLNDERRSQLAAQITWTLAPVAPSVTGIRLMVDGEPLVVREQNADGVIPINALRRYAPVPAGTATDLYGVRNGRVMRVTEANGQPVLDDVGGPFGAAGAPEAVGQFALSGPGDRIAAVVRDGTELRVGSTDAPEAEQLIAADRVWNPQYTRFGELWALVDDGAGTGLAVWVEGRRRSVSADLSGDLLAFRISPDGLRMAVIERAADGTQRLGVMRLSRSDRISVGQWHELIVPGEPEATRLKDVGWLDPTSLIVLVADGEDAPARPYTVNQEGSNWQLVGQPDNWNAARVAVSPARDEQRAMILTTDNTVLRYEDDFRWPMFISDITSIAFPG